MLLCMDEKIAHFTLKEANNARKICAKKKLSEIPALHEKFIKNCSNENFGSYIWETAIAPQMSYAFAEPQWRGAYTPNRFINGVIRICA